MTAAISARLSSGSTTPVDDLLPNTIAMKVTVSISRPLIPALPNPIIKPEDKTSAHSAIVKSGIMHTCLEEAI